MCGENTLRTQIIDGTEVIGLRNLTTAAMTSYRDAATVAWRLSETETTFFGSVIKENNEYYLTYWQAVKLSNRILREPERITRHLDIVFRKEHNTKQNTFTIQIYESDIPRLMELRSKIYATVPHSRELSVPDVLNYALSMALLK